MLCKFRAAAVSRGGVIAVVAKPWRVRCNVTVNLCAVLNLSQFLLLSPPTTFIRGPARSEEGIVSTFSVIVSLSSPVPCLFYPLPPPSQPVRVSHTPHYHPPTWTNGSGPGGWTDNRQAGMGSAMWGQWSSMQTTSNCCLPTITKIATLTIFRIYAQLSVRVGRSNPFPPPPLNRHKNHEWWRVEEW